MILCSHSEMLFYFYVLGKTSIFMYFCVSKVKLAND